MEKQMTSKEFFNHVLKILSDKASENDYMDDELIMIPQLVETGRQYVMKWLSDTAFKDTFKGNTTGYYLSLCANAVGGGMMYASSWADSENKLRELKYDALYDGSVWENIFALAELGTAAEKTEFQKFIICLFEAWVKEAVPYLSCENAGDYLIESFNAFFLVGAGIKLCTLGF